MENTEKRFSSPVPPQSGHACASPSPWRTTLSNSEPHDPHLYSKMGMKQHSNSRPVCNRTCYHYHYHWKIPPLPERGRSTLLLRHPRTALRALPRETGHLASFPYRSVASRTTLIRSRVSCAPAVTAFIQENLSFAPAPSPTRSSIAFPSSPPARAFAASASSPHGACPYRFLNAYHSLSLGALLMIAGQWAHPSSLSWFPQVSAPPPHTSPLEASVPARKLPSASSGEPCAPE